jgi:hypothetical protein
MTIIIPLIIVALIIGFSSRKMTGPLWFLVVLSILAVMGKAFLKG